MKLLLRLTVGVEYETNDVPESVLRDKLTWIASQAAFEGLFSGDTEAQVERWKSEVSTVSKGDPGLGTLCFHTDSSPDDWEEFDGPATGVGVERWFHNRENSSEAYIVEDQGEISISIQLAKN